MTSKSQRATRRSAGFDPAKRAAKRRAQEAAGFKRKAGKGASKQMSRAQSAKARKKAKEGERKEGRDR